MSETSLSNIPVVFDFMQLKPCRILILYFWDVKLLNCGSPISQKTNAANNLILAAFVNFS